MQKTNTPKPTAKASGDAERAEASGRLIDAECKLDALLAMSTALSDLLRSERAVGFPPAARRRIAAAYGVAGAVESMAEGAVEDIRNAMMQVFRASKPQDQSVRVGNIVLPFRCERDDMVEFVNILKDHIDMLKLLQLAVRAPDAFEVNGPDPFDDNPDVMIGGISALRERMRQCFEPEERAAK